MQWDQSQAQWGQQPPMDAQWGQPQAQWGQQPPMDAQWGQPQAQWGQQPPMDAQWGQQPPMGAQWGQPQAQWGQQPPMDAQWGQPIAGNQWGTPDVWSQMADKPQETQAGLGAIPGNAAYQQNWNGQASVRPGPPPPPPAIPKKISEDDDDWDAWGDSAKEKATTLKTGANASKAVNSIVIGKPMTPEASEGTTRQIDIDAIQKLYGDRINPFVEFFKSIPLRYLIIAGSVVLVSIIGFSIGAWLINRPAESVKEFTKDGDLITDDTPEYVRSFDDIVNASKSLSSAFVAVDGDNIREGSIVAVSPQIGVVYNERKIATFEEVKSGMSPPVNKILNVVQKDVNRMSEPIIFLFDEMIPMSAVYRTMYSFGASSRKIYIGGTTQTGITTIPIKPCHWPDYGLVPFGECSNIKTELKITTFELTLKRIEGTDPLMLTPEGEGKMELRDNIIGGKVHVQNISGGLARMRASQSERVIVSPDGNVSFGVFMRAVQVLWGSSINPNVKEMYLNKIPNI